MFDHGVQNQLAVSYSTNLHPFGYKYKRCPAICGDTGLNHDGAGFLGPRNIQIFLRDA